MTVVSANPVVCGRKLCVSPHHQGPRWTLAINFSVSHRNGRDVPEMRNVCRTCTQRQRTVYRESLPEEIQQLRKERGRLYNQARRANMTDEEREAERVRDRVRQGKDPELEALVAPVEPFVKDIERWLNSYGRRIQAAPWFWLERRDARHIGITRLAEEARISDKQLRRYLDREAYYIELATADRLAMALGTPLCVLAEDFESMQKLLREHDLAIDRGAVV